MYCMRRSGLRKNTLAALYGAGEETLPETLASPASSDCPSANALHAISRNAWNQFAARMVPSSGENPKNVLPCGAICQRRMPACLPDFKKKHLIGQEEHMAEAQMVDPHEVVMTGENSFVRLSNDGGETIADRV